MSVFTPKRVFLVVVSLLIAATALANNPTPLTLARMAFDEKNGQAVLFGGRGLLDQATGVVHSSDQTWILEGSRWSQRFPAHSPAGRSAHAMAYDSKRGRIVLFGGFTDPSKASERPTFLNDTWVWENGDWQQIVTPAAPSPRYYSALAYDSDRDRMVLFGGVVATADGKATETLHDTWEFDGTNWTRILESGATKAGKPALAYDPSRKQMVLVGVTDALATAMYVYNPATPAWAAPSPAPEKLPTCANEGVIAYQTHLQKIAYIGGTCVTGTPASEEVWEWDGANWAKVTTNAIDKATGVAFTYDTNLRRAIFFGGITFGDTAPRSTQIVYRDGLFSFNLLTNRPRPRSLAALETDTANGTMWLFGGLNEYQSGYTGDFWRYGGNGQWHPIALTGDGLPPLGCVTPASAFDKNRNRLILSCYGAELYEFDGAAWKSFASQETRPGTRRFFSLSYDETLKKTVLFGGYDDGSGNFRNDTWTWDGTAWAEVKNNRPPHRSLTMMWYDPLLKKTIIYGGVGRPNIDQRVTRYEDMWTFDGSGWTALNVSNGPGPRLGAQFAVNPVTGRMLLFGGLRAEKIDDKTTNQFYDNDTWEWNGATSSWARLEPSVRPSARENGAMAWDPIGNVMTLFGGYKGGLYLSDVWFWNGTTWTPHVVSTGRRRAANQ